MTPAEALRLADEAEQRAERASAVTGSPVTGIPADVPALCAAIRELAAENDNLRILLGKCVEGTLGEELGLR